MSGRGGDSLRALSGGYGQKLWVLLPVGLLVGLLDQIGRWMPASWPRRHLDSSWMIGLQMMRDQELPFGYAGTFNYGPWGFLTAPTGIDLGDLWLAGLFRIGAVALLFLALHACLPDRRWSVPAAVGAALMLGNCNQAGWVLMLALAAAALGVLARSRPISPAMVALFAAATALAIQIKTSEGVLSVFFLGMLVLTSRSWRVWVAAASSFVVASLALWVMAGQDLRDLPGWLDLGVEIVRGYGEGMAYTADGVITWLLLLAAAITVIAVLLHRGLPWPARVGMLGMVLFLLKSSLTRVDAIHVLPGYSGVLVLMVVILATPAPRISRLRLLVVPVGAVLALLLASVNLPILPPRHYSFDEWPLATQPELHRERLATARADIVDDLDLDSSVLEQLADHPVSVDPWEISAVWAHDLRWQPLPIFQQYQANTPRLDEANATALLADPDHRVLREEFTVDDVNQLWAGPAYTVALMCNFDVVADDGEWAVHARTANRCGDERRLSSGRVSAGEETELPEPEDSLIAVRFVPDSRSLADRLIGITGFQRHLLHATVDDEKFRLPEALAGGPLIVGASGGVSGLLDVDLASTISFDRAGELEVIEIPLLGPESE